MKITENAEYDHSCKTLTLLTSHYKLIFVWVSQGELKGFDLTVAERSGIVLDKSEFRLNPLIFGMLKGLMGG